MKKMPLDIIKPSLGGQIANEMPHIVKEKRNAAREEITAAVALLTLYVCLERIIFMVG